MRNYTENMLAPECLQDDKSRKILLTPAQKVPKEDPNGRHELRKT
jgi:hypothetical protein